ncbi:MAG: DUF998 domain-containing protein [Nitrososphaerota archaeon]
MARLASILLFVGIAQFMVFLRVSEAVYPGYSVAGNYISDLGVGPAAPIFNTSIIVLGVLVISASLLVYRVFHDLAFTVLVFMTGFGAAGVGVFPEGSPYNLHMIMSFMVFFSAGLSAIAAYRVTPQPLKTISIFSGILTLTTLILFASGTYLGLGHGGMERMIAYPPLIWGLVLAGYLMMLKPEE